ncbi:hypothetical protein DLAC_03984 [Tieghemostelium lacteum]|uniref:C3H1-type domain-containing protein n=1 Tax=Tieghemostelium lacteum TaxID=361077 RepID=A0A151ZRN7_TIELA|nr:hypothetical protein DLAC_03984 [Tieghemostelium lacteum]|eukprot:KYQ96691.1 hypothetical protein DLAC_03984 [Tieghemostelium lacteum]
MNEIEIQQKINQLKNLIVTHKNQVTNKPPLIHHQQPNKPYSPPTFKKFNNTISYPKVPQYKAPVNFKQIPTTVRYNSPPIPKPSASIPTSATTINKISTIPYKPQPKPIIARKPATLTYKPYYSHPTTKYPFYNYTSTFKKTPVNYFQPKFSFYNSRASVMANPRARSRIIPTFGLQKSAYLSKYKALDKTNKLVTLLMKSPSVQPKIIDSIFVKSGNSLVRKSLDDKYIKVGNKLIRKTDQPTSTSTTNKTITSIKPQPIINITKSLNRPVATILKKSSGISNSKKTSEKLKQYLTNKKKKNRDYCLFFNRFGKCNNGDKCKYEHDKSKVRTCPKYLQGKCNQEDCLLKHEATDIEQMPVCYQYLRGKCFSENCPYLHANVSKDAKVCQDFLKGVCTKGSLCKLKHTYSTKSDQPSSTDVTSISNGAQSETITPTDSFFDDFDQSLFN